MLLQGFEPLFRDAITLEKFPCRTIAPERLIIARLNLKLKKNEIKCCFKGLKALFRDAITL